MNKVSKTEYTDKELGTNPCQTSLVIPVNEIPFKNQYKRDGDELLPVVGVLEVTPFVRVYATAEHRKIVCALSPAASKLLLWVMYDIKHGKDAIWINKDRLMHECSISLNTYKKALEELIRYALFAYTIKRDVYWINPEFFFKGDRVKKYPKCVLIVKSNDI